MLIAENISKFIKETGEVFHLVECFTDHMIDIYCEESLPYLDYLESLVMKLK